MVSHYSALQRDPAAPPQFRIATRAIRGAIWGLWALIAAGCGGTPEDVPAPQVIPAQVTAPVAVEPEPEPATGPVLAADADAERDRTAKPGPGIVERPRDRPVAESLTPELSARRVVAQECRAQGDLRRAIELLSAAETELGDSATLRLDRTACLLELSAAVQDDAESSALRAQAARALDEAVALAPDLPGAVVLRSRLAIADGDRAGARSLLAVHLERFPGDAPAHFELGEQAFADKDLALADTHLSLAAELDPSDGHARLRATLAKQWLASEGGAAYTTYVLRQGYREAARLLPEDDEPLRLVIGLYPERSPRRMQALQDVIDDHPGAVRARLRQAELVLGAPDPDVAQALAILDSALTLAPESVNVREVRGRALITAGRVVEAVDVYIAVLRDADADLRLRVSNALDALLHPGDPARGISLEQRERACDALVAANPHDGRFGNNAGFWFREEAKDHDTSARFYAEAVAASPDDQDFLNDTGFVYLEHLRDWKERCEPLFLAARRLVEEDGQQPIRGYWDALEHLCRYYYEIGRDRDVILCAELRANPEAQLNGRPYASASAEAFRKKAQARIDAQR